MIPSPNSVCIILTIVQINSMSTSDSEGPAWNKFWMSMDNETESIMSGEGSSHAAPHTPAERGSMMMSPDPHARPGMDRLDSVLPDDSASHHGAEEDISAITGAVEDHPFTFKFKAPSGRVHRLQIVASAGLEILIGAVAEKLGSEAESIGGVPSFTSENKISHTGFALSYMDNEGDTVSITTDHDLLEAITLAQSARKDKVDLFVHDPEKPAIPPTTEPQPAIIPPTPPESQVRQRKKAIDGEEDEQEEAVPAPKVKKAAQPAAQEQIIQGVPNDLLLPGALVVLGVAIVVTFAIARSGR